MEGISFLTDDRNNKIAVQIDLRKHGELWENFYKWLDAQNGTNGKAANSIAPKEKNSGKNKSRLLNELKEAVHNVNLAKQGKLKPKPLSELLNEL